MGTWNFLEGRFTGHVSCISQESRWDFGHPHPPAEGHVSPPASAYPGSRSLLACC